MGSCCASRAEYAPAPSDDEPQSPPSRRAMAELRQSQQQPPPPQHQQPPQQQQPQTPYSPQRAQHGRSGAPPTATTAAVDRKLQEVMGKWNRVISPDPQQNVLMAVAIQMGELKLQMCRQGADEAEAFESVCRTYDGLLAELDIDDLAQENPTLYEQLVVANKHMIGTYGHAPPLAHGLPRSPVDDTPVAPPTQMSARPAFGEPDFARRPPSGATSSF